MQNRNESHCGLLGTASWPGIMGSGETSTIRGAATPSRNGKWTFQRAQALPFFPLTNATVIMFSPHIVAARLCDSFRLRSVHAEYDGPQATCTTSSYLTYSVTLYEEEGGGNTMLEVIRIDGCGFAFRKEREAIVASAQGKGGVPPSQLPVMMKLSEPILQNFKAPTEGEHEDMLLRASDQLQSSKYKTRMFHLEHLSALSSADKVNQETAQIMSRLMMKNSSRIQERLLVIITVCLTNYDDHNKRMINHCVSFLHNALSLLSDLDLLEDFLIEYEHNVDFVTKVVPLLVQIVSSTKCPHNASLALRCLSLLYKSSAIAQDVLDEEPHSYIAGAAKVGKQRHFRLQKEAEALLATLK